MPASALPNQSGILPCAASGDWLAHTGQCCILGNLPYCWTSKLLTAFVHQVDFPDLKFSRPCFWKQFTTFQFAVKALMKDQTFPFELLRRKSLFYMGVFLEVPSLPITPKKFKHFREAFLAAIGPRSWKTFKNAVFSTPGCEVWTCPVQVSTPKDIWAAYYAKQQAASVPAFGVVLPCNSQVCASNVHSPEASVTACRNTRSHIILTTQKGTIILTTTHMRRVSYVAQALRSSS